MCVYGRVIDRGKNTKTHHCDYLSCGLRTRAESSAIRHQLYRYNNRPYTHRVTAIIIWGMKKSFRIYDWRPDDCVQRGDGIPPYGLHLVCRSFFSTIIVFYLFIIKKYTLDQQPRNLYCKKHETFSPKNQSGKWYTTRLTCVHRAIWIVSKTLISGPVVRQISQRAGMNLSDRPDSTSL